ncbi:MAG: hypothetical protein ACKO70_00495 [Actinomycetota bacterium]
MTRKRRTREETRELLLDAAVRVVLARSNGDLDGSTNPLAGVRITDALEEVNRLLRDRDPSAPQMTTGAAYNIWPSQEEFQQALLDKILLDAATPEIDRVKAELDSGLRQGLDWRELVTRCFGVDFEVSYEEPTMFLMIGMTALAPPQRLSTMNKESNERYLAETGAILHRILEHGGRHMAPGLTVDDLVWAIEAIESGYMLRRRAEVDVTDRKINGHTVVQSAILAVAEDFTVDAGA